MNKEYMCHCGLYCGNCAVKAKVEPAAKALHNEMQKAGFEDIIHFIPDGEGFWRFLKSVAETGACVSCRAGSGNPGCTVRICAQERGGIMCAECAEYPCAKFDEFFKAYPILESDNALLRDKGIAEWADLQDTRRKCGFTYTDGGSI